MTASAQNDRPGAPTAPEVGGRWDALKLVVDPVELAGEAVDALFARQATDQADAAKRLALFDTSGCLRVPWESLDAIVGPILPWNFWVLAAHTGNGKSTAAMSMVARWMTEERRVYMLPLEQPTDVMRLYLAAIRNELHTSKVLAGKWHELPSGAQQTVLADLDWQKSPDAAGLLHFSDSSAVDELVLRRAFEDAQAFGAEVIVVDHLHQLQMTGHGNPHQALVQMCHAIKELVKVYRIPLIGLAQLHRGDGDMLAPFRPPKPTAIQGGEVIRQLADMVIALYRPLLPMTRGDESEVRNGELPLKRFLEPHTVGVHVLKHRIDGEQFGEIVKLRYEKGMILDRPSPSARYEP